MSLWSSYLPRSLLSVVVGENKTFKGPEEYVRSRGVKLEVMNDAECITLMEDFIAKHPKLWYEGTLEDK